MGPGPLERLRLHRSDMRGKGHLYTRSTQNPDQPQPPPALAHYHDKELDGAQYGIRLKGGVTLPGPDYDEWDCLNDMEEAGLIVDVGTGINPAYRMTEKGCDVAARLRKHKAMGGQYAEFTPNTEPESEPVS